jgi:tetratricopeptide (TPR) repeat protein
MLRTAVFLTLLFAYAGDHPTMVAPAFGAEPVGHSAQTAEPTAPLFDNLGDHHHPISTDSTLAQRYFDQGLALTYAFNHAEAVRSFRQAADLDPKCAMCYWGVALALGPNINAPMTDQAVPEAYEAVQKAQDLASSEREQAYIQALAKRYSPEPVEDRANLDAAYAQAMREVAHRYPEDLDAATLYAEAVMDTQPWNYWTEDGQPRPGTAEVLGMLEYVLAHDPDHPGANHYYIHVVEASPHPERGLPSAYRLKDLVPGAGHLVHMPAHIYLRLGQYHEASLANQRAIEADQTYLAKTGAQGLYAVMYYPHNFHFLSYTTSLEGRSADTIAAAAQVAANVPRDLVRKVHMLEVFLPARLFALARFGKWDEILNEPQPSAEFPYERAVWHYVRGLAFARKRHAAEAIAEAEDLESIAGSEALRALEMPAFYAASQMDIAQKILAAEIAGLQGKHDKMIRQFEAAVQAQDKLPYMEPPYWYYPVRQSLGAALMAIGRPMEAEAVYRRDLEKNPDNGWSLFGLLQSLRVQGKGEQAQEVQDRFARAWVHADVTLTASVF